MKNLSILKQQRRLPALPHFAIILSSVFALLLLAGCATKAPPKTETYSFFPPKPDEPRVQFLTAVSSDADMGKKSQFAEFVTGQAATKKPLVKPYGLALKDGKLYVCDTMLNAIEVFDFQKKMANYFAPPGEGRLQTPINITIDADDTRYIADTGRGQVLIYDKNDEYVSAIGKKGEMKPCDVVVTPDRLYIADVKGHCVRVLNKADHKPLFDIPRDPAKATEDKLFSPTNLAVDGEGRLYVSDTGAYAIRVFDLEGKYLRTIGQAGVAPGLFARPKGIAVDRNGIVYVVDAATQVVQLFDPEGKLLMFFGQPGGSTYGQLSLPAAVKLDYDNVGLFQDKIAPGKKCEYLILVTSQTGSVSIYGFLQK